jgi:hypothetical protein
MNMHFLPPEFLPRDQGKAHSLPTFAGGPLKKLILVSPDQDSLFKLEPIPYPTPTRSGQPSPNGGAS